MFDSKRVSELENATQEKDEVIRQLESKVGVLERDVENRKSENRDLQFSLKCREREIALQIEESKNTLRKDMEKTLIESDLLRTEAVATLKAYEKIDTKAEREHIIKMLEKCIENFPKMKSDVVVNNK
jgi:hypothetical protein